MAHSNGSISRCTYIPDGRWPNREDHCLLIGASNASTDELPNSTVIPDCLGLFWRTKVLFRMSKSFFPACRRNEWIYRLHAHHFYFLSLLSRCEIGSFICHGIPIPDSTSIPPTCWPCPVGISIPLSPVLSFRSLTVARGCFPLVRPFSTEWLSGCHLVLSCQTRAYIPGHHPKTYPATPSPPGLPILTVQCLFSEKILAQSLAIGEIEPNSVPIIV